MIRSMKKEVDISVVEGEGRELSSVYRGGEVG